MSTTSLRLSKATPPAAVRSNASSSTPLIESSAPLSLVTAFTATNLLPRKSSARATALGQQGNLSLVGSLTQPSLPSPCHPIALSALPPSLPPFLAPPSALQHSAGTSSWGNSGPWFWPYPAHVGCSARYRRPSNTRTTLAGGSASAPRSMISLMTFVGLRPSWATAPLALRRLWPQHPPRLVRVTRRALVWAESFSFHQPTTPHRTTQSSGANHSQWPSNASCSRTATLLALSPTVTWNLPARLPNMMSLPTWLTCGSIPCSTSTTTRQPSSGSARAQPPPPAPRHTSFDSRRCISGFTATSPAMTTFLAQPMPWPTIVLGFGNCLMPSCSRTLIPFTRRLHHGNFAACVGR